MFCKDFIYFLFNPSFLVIFMLTILNLFGAIHFTF